jgi:MoaF N-terminal domain
MGEIPRAAAIRGTTMRWAWTEGPTKGQVHEHIFHKDGTVEWQEVGKASGAMAGPGARERPPYAAYEVSREVYAVSYLAPSGFTLTVVLNFATRQLVGFASSKDQWFPLSGTFELVG